MEHVNNNFWKIIIEIGASVDPFPFSRIEGSTEFKCCSSPSNRWVIINYDWDEHNTSKADYREIHFTLTIIVSLPIPKNLKPQSIHTNKKTGAPPPQIARENEGREMWTKWSVVRIYKTTCGAIILHVTRSCWRLVNCGGKPEALATFRG